MSWIHTVGLGLGRENDLMYVDAIGIVAALANEFPDLPLRSVVRAVKQSVDQLPEGSPALIMGAARARLRALQRSGAGV